ncbi:MAG TPA: helix-turn-helix domain-containing protein [Roseiflexaceae bacterium]|nr:helix-turn-helix domain-containing protein [Roseiflexaceae bacterium]
MSEHNPKATYLSIVRDPSLGAARMLKYAEAAALLKVDKRTVRRRVADGRYVAYGDGSGRRILYSSIVADIQRGW